MATDIAFPDRCKECWYACSSVDTCIFPYTPTGVSEMSEIGSLYRRENIRAIAEGRKTQTRRVMVPQPSFCFEVPRIIDSEYWELGHWGYCSAETRNIWQPTGRFKLRYPVGSILFMPKWAARPELKRRVTDVKVERVQDISEEDAKAEGVEYLFNAQTCKTLAGIKGTKPEDHGYKNYLYHGLVGKTITQKQSDAWPYQYSNYSTAKLSFSSLWDSINSKPKGVYKTIDGKEVITHYVSYPWEDIQETREHRGKPWHVCGNPWVFAYTFERRQDY